jgi:hypothetical protein
MSRTTSIVFTKLVWLPVLGVCLLLLTAGEAWPQGRGNPPPAANPPQGVNPNDRIVELEDRLTAVIESLLAAEERIAELEAKLPHVRTQEGELNGLGGPHLIIEGCNVHIRSGSGATDDQGGLLGAGNLIVGYNEEEPVLNWPRTGSHNLVVGRWHGYSSYGGLVAGELNRIDGPASSVSGGISNVASGSHASVSGGSDNVASGEAASVSGGGANMASGPNASVSGGIDNTARGDHASVSGGMINTASGTFASVLGGFRNIASGRSSTVLGKGNRHADGLGSIEPSSFPVLPDGF